MSADSHDAATLARVAGTALVEDYERTIKEYMILQEFKLLKEHIPEGLYIMPATSNIFHWHGTVFLRKGTYAAGIFKFLIDIPATFPEERPRVFFKTPLFHPLVHEKTGELDLDPELEGWPTSHRFMGHILNYIKRIFFRPQLCDPKPGRRAFNPTALSLLATNAGEYQACVRRCVDASVSGVYGNQGGYQGETLDAPYQFSRFTAAHRSVIERVFAQADEDNAAAASAAAAAPVAGPTLLAIGSISHAYSGLSNVSRGYSTASDLAAASVDVGAGSNPDASPVGGWAVGTALGGLPAPTVTTPSGVSDDYSVPSAGPVSQRPPMLSWFSPGYNQLPRT